MPRELEGQQSASMGGAALELYIAGDSLNGRKAIANLEEIIRRLGIPMSFVIVDVVKDPKRAFTSRIFATPSLVYSVNGKRRLIVGDLSDIDVVVQGLKS